MWLTEYRQNFHTCEYIHQLKILQKVPNVKILKLVLADTIFLSKQKVKISLAEIWPLDYRKDYKTTEKKSENISPLGSTTTFRPILLKLAENMYNGKSRIQHFFL
jgi:hypothetical protein